MRNMKNNLQHALSCPCFHTSVRLASQFVGFGKLAKLDELDEQKPQYTTNHHSVQIAQHDVLKYKLYLSSVLNNRSQQGQTGSLRFI